MVQKDMIPSQSYAAPGFIRLTIRSGEHIGIRISSIEVFYTTKVAGYPTESCVKTAHNSYFVVQTYEEIEKALTLTRNNPHQTQPTVEPIPYKRNLLK